MSCVYLSLAEKARNQVGVLPTPRLHCREAVPSATSTASLMGKGSIFLPESVWLRCTRLQVKLHRRARAHRCLTGLWVPPRDALDPQGRSSPADTGSLLLFQYSDGNQHPSRCGHAPAPSDSGMRAEAGGEGAGAVLGAFPLGLLTAELGAGEPRCAGSCSLVMHWCATG